ncbi:ygfZ [Wigglesworthia glossinidia endosymbiont of Glossina brevipalpis]|uniref:YgfZ protein n=1 Tax=Wigglesworthia glossinidia brevipalpis TaxID=36870 RepID=Q8D2B7_WIGBR|nr:ygfZ [Wigglesworthia glossinidia endosymbiont of Glossina brevipalpis]
MFICLSNLILVKIIGNDALKLLQNQFTSNFFCLKKNEFKFSAHCNEKGKVISNMCVFYYQNKISYIQPKIINFNQIEILKKYSTFYKVDIILNKELVLLGSYGTSAEKKIKSIFFEIPNEKNKVINYKDCAILYFKFKNPFYLIIINKRKREDIFYKLKLNNTFYNYKKYLFEIIKLKYPVIEPITSEHFFPQEINLNYFHAIDFNKGCYMGQELIYKMQYLKIKKKFLYILYGKSSFLPKAGDIIEQKMINKWNFAGKILSVYKVKKFYFLIQSVLKVSILNQNRNRFRIKSDLEKSINNFSCFRFIN